MSKAIKSRTADQCRSHHQKMMKYHRSIQEIVSHIEYSEVKVEELEPAIQLTQKE